MSAPDWSQKPQDFPIWIVPKPGFDSWPSDWHKDSGELFVDRHGRPWTKSGEGKQFEVFTDPNGWPISGLPPVGAVCEANRLGRVKSDNHPWFKVKILAHWTDDDRISPVAVYMPLGESPPHVAQGVACCFRPIPTPEQIADEEIRAGLNEMIRHIKDHPLGTHGVSHLQELMIHEDVARDLWAAGYRKQEAS
ncbi:hypothetical protein BLX42_22380 [Pseudomonas sp. SG-MS2]|uniref:hypothetical protein n=1 Tax=Pseudomonas sp. SG-MS2 TaxID=1914534 RepID=UPI001379C72F|nr:hypothetical protein [Pseudomonas sp. SG-MS2]KAF1306981.1 hypothetical protein BLX42_22380 [Pseudomonas sp. SG-MS2]